MADVVEELPFGLQHRLQAVGRQVPVHPEVEWKLGVVAVDLLGDGALVGHPIVVDNDRDTDLLGWCVIEPVPVGLYRGFGGSNRHPVIGPDRLEGVGRLGFDQRLHRLLGRGSPC